LSSIIQKIAVVVQKIATLILLPVFPDACSSLFCAGLAERFAKLGRFRAAANAIPFANLG
jgi:hypothetical protein